MERNIDVCSTDVTREEGRLHVSRMPQLAHATDQEDDWTGTTDAVLRRKKQNRLNVRAYRHRKRVQRALEPADQIAPKIGGPSRTELVHEVNNAAGSCCIIQRPAQSEVSMWSLTAPMNDSEAGISLSSDHLRLVIRYNVLHACLLNRELLSILESPKFCIDSDFSSSNKHILHPPSDRILLRLPPSLHPTNLQMTLLHSPWIDMMPHPVLRDNLILAQGGFDENDFRLDIVGRVSNFDESSSHAGGVVVWSTPWQVDGWEITEAFCFRWGWVLRGCEEVIMASNRWRRMRGEEELDCGKV